MKASVASTDRLNMRSRPASRLASMKASMSGWSQRRVAIMAPRRWPALMIVRHIASQTCWEMAETCGMSWLVYCLTFMKCFNIVGISRDLGKPRRGTLQPPLELGHEGLAWHPGRDRREELEGDRARPLDELPAAPEE